MSNTTKYPVSYKPLPPTQSEIRKSERVRSMRRKMKQTSKKSVVKKLSNELYETMKSNMGEYLSSEQELIGSRLMSFDYMGKYVEITIGVCDYEEVLNK
jgi:hypothetical protein